MKVTIENVDEIKRRLQYIYTTFNLEDEPEVVNIGDEYIYIQFPVEEDRIPEFKVDDFWEYSEDIESLRIVDNSTVRTNMIRQTILDYHRFDLTD